MPLPSTTLTFDVWRQTAAGAAATGKLIADFGYAHYLDGTVQAITTTLTEGATVGLWRAYKMAQTVPATTGTYQAFFDVASGTDVVAGGLITVDLQAYNETSLAGLILTSQGVPGVRTTVASSLGSVKSGDSFNSGTLTVPLGKLTPFSFSDLSGLTITAEGRTAPGTPSSSVAYTAAIVSSGDRTFYFKWDTMPVGMVLTTEQSVRWYIDVQFKETASPNRVITTNSYYLDVTWDANDTV